MSESYFSSTYDEARSRFIECARAVGATLQSYPVKTKNDEANDFTIDVAILGAEAARTIVVSSGVHGVEGFFGSAIQLAKLSGFEKDSSANVRWVFIHAVNPVGFARIRRFNEDNVDLNRNFLFGESKYAGAPEYYGRLNAFLNPPSEPSRYEPFLLKAAWYIARYGLQALKQSVAGGQYEYPRGIFFGGSEPSQAMKIIREHCQQWVGSASHVLHVDFHSGLGTFGDYSLLLAETAGSADCQWYENVFGKEKVEATVATNGTAYKASGSMGEWLQHFFADCAYRFVTAEFGTYSLTRVLAAIRAENRAHFFASEQSPNYQNAKQELLECFCPADIHWRRRVIASGLKILQQGVAGELT